MAKQADTYSDNNNRTIAYVRYIKIRTWLRGFRVKIANFSRLRCLAIPRRDLGSKKTKPDIEKWPESLGVMVNISDVGYLRSFSNHEGCPIHPNWIRWTKAMNNQTHRKSVRERLGSKVELRRGRWFKNGVYYMCCALVWSHQWLTEQCIFYLLWWYFAVYFLSLSRTDFRWVRSTLARTNSLHRIRSSLFASIFYPPLPVNDQKELVMSC